MKFSVEQHYDASARRVFDAFRDPDTHASLPDFGRISRPEFVEARDDRDRHIVSLRYRFTADLPTAALAVIDPRKLSWVEETTYDPATLTAATRFIPDNYASKLEAAADAEFVDDADGSVRRVDGRFRVKILLGAGPVERAIVSGLREHLDEEAVHVAALLEGD